MDAVVGHGGNTISWSCAVGTSRCSLKKMPRPQATDKVQLA